MYEALDTCADDQPRAHWPRLRGVTEIYLPTELHIAQFRAGGAVEYAVCPDSR